MDYNLALPMLSQAIKSKCVKCAFSAKQWLTKFQVQHEAAHQDAQVGADDRKGEGRVPAQVGPNSGGRHGVRRKLRGLRFEAPRK